MSLFLVDIDGTVALRDTSREDVRGPFDWSRVGEDIPNHPVIEVVRALDRAGHELVFVSGRSRTCAQETVEWLLEHIGVPGEVFMRKEGDYRPDFIVKKEIYEKYIEPFWEKPLAVLDDRNSVVSMWREELGLACFQVADGDF